MKQVLFKELHTLPTQRVGHEPVASESLAHNLNLRITVSGIMNSFNPLNAKGYGLR